MAVCKRGAVVPETSDQGQDDIEVSRSDRKENMPAIGPYNCSYLTSLGASYFFFFFSYFIAAFGNQPVIISFVVAISYYLL